MRIVILLPALIMLTFTSVRAQEKPSALVKGESATVVNNLVKVETLFPNVLSVSYEKKLGQHISLYNMLGIFAYGGSGITAQLVYGVSPYYVIVPSISVQPRFYHNLAKRAASDKNIKYNSANYIGFSARFYHERVYLSNSDRVPPGPAVLDLMLSYGLQRTFFKRINWDMAFEPGIEFYDGQAGFFIGIKLQLGVVVFSN